MWYGLISLTCDSFHISENFIISDAYTVFIFTILEGHFKYLSNYHYKLNQKNALTSGRFRAVLYSVSK